MLNFCITGRQLVEVFTSLLDRGLSSIHKLLVSVKCVCGKRSFLSKESDTLRPYRVYI